MQDNVMQLPMQPFIKLIQSNMELLTRFSTSPEVITQAMANMQSMFQQGQGSVSAPTQSNAFAELMQGMLRNYTEFVAEMTSSGMAMLTQGQAAMMQTAQEASSAVLVDASEARGSGKRRAA